MVALIHNVGNAPQGMDVAKWQEYLQLKERALAARNVEQTFWQSRATLTGRRVPDLPELTDINALASELRRSFPRRPVAAPRPVQFVLPLRIPASGALGSAA